MTVSKRQIGCSILVLMLLIVVLYNVILHQRTVEILPEEQLEQVNYVRFNEYGTWFECSQEEDLEYIQGLAHLLSGTYQYKKKWIKYPFMVGQSYDKVEFYNSADKLLCSIGVTLFKSNLVLVIDNCYYEPVDHSVNYRTYVQYLQAMREAPNTVQVSTALVEMKETGDSITITNPSVLDVQKRLISYLIFNQEVGDGAAEYSITFANGDVYHINETDRWARKDDKEAKLSEEDLQYLKKMFE